MTRPSRLLAAAGLAVFGGAAAASITAAWLRSSPLPPAIAAPDRPPLTPGPPRRVGVVVNPAKHGAREALDVVRSSLRRAGWEEPRVYETTVEDPGAGQVRAALAAGCELVLAMGGDGTVRQAAAQLADTEAILGIIPLGTGNLLARNLELPFTDPAGCVQIALHGHPHRIDLIGIRAKLAEGEEVRQRFTVMGGAGFDAQIMTDTRDRLKARLGWIAYVEAGMRNLVARRHSVSITVDDAAPVRRKTRSVIVANTGDLTAGIRLAEASRLDDARLETIVLTPRSLLDWAALTWQVISRRRGLLPVIEHLHGRRVHVDFLHHPQPMEVDGDYVGEVRAFTAEVQPGVLRVQTA